MNRLPKLLAVLFTLFLVAGAVQAKDFTSNGVTYRVVDEKNQTAEVVASAGSAYRDAVAIPSNAEGYTIIGVGYNAFGGCTELTNITFASSITYIGQAAFSGCTSLGNFALPNSLTKLSNNAFYGCTSITALTLPGSLSEVGTSVFSECTALASVTMKEGMEVVGTSMFSGCINLTGISVPNSVSSIGSNAFYGCKRLATATIGNGVKTIGYQAFGNCTSLESLVLGSAVTEIGQAAFNGCSGLRQITCRAAEPPSLGNSPFSDDTYTAAVLFVPFNSVGAYQEHAVWGKFARIEAIRESVVLTVNDAEQGSTRIILREVDPVLTLGFAPADGWAVSSVSYNGIDVTQELVDGEFTTPKITANATLTVVYAQSTGVHAAPAPRLKVRASASGLSLDGTEEGTPVLVYNTEGRLLASATAEAGITNVAFHYEGVVIIRVGEYAYKVKM